MCAFAVHGDMLCQQGDDMPKPATMSDEQIDVRTAPEVKAEILAIETVSLRDANRDSFFAALESPPEQNTALRKLFAEGRRPRA